MPRVLVRGWRASTRRPASGLANQVDWAVNEQPDEVRHDLGVLAADAQEPVEPSYRGVMARAHDSAVRVPA